MAWPSKEVHEEQRAEELTEELAAEIAEIVARYPDAQAALIPALSACLERMGHVSSGTALAVARLLDIAPSKVTDTLSFYSMLRDEPVGRHHIELCRTLSCALTGADTLADYLTGKLGIDFGEVAPDGRFSLGKVECIGACDAAPAMLINNELYGNLDAGRIDEILGGLT